MYGESHWTQNDEDRGLLWRKEERKLNAKETAIAQGKQEIIKTKFEEWIWKDQQRREHLVRIYNDKFNCIRPREYDGKYITFVGMNPEIRLRKHQVNAVARQLYGGNALLAHEVRSWKNIWNGCSSNGGKKTGTLE